MAPRPSRDDDGDPAEFLDQLVAIWNATHQPDVADLIDAIADQVPHAPLTGAAKDREARWHEAAARGKPASALGALLATPWPTQWSDGLKRLEALRKWRDPRIPAVLRA